MRRAILTGLQYLIQQLFISTLAGKLANSRKIWLKNILIKRFINAYAIDLSTAVLEKVEDYTSFNAFFTRHIKKELRPIAAAANAIISPVDGVIAQIGQIHQQELLQAKNFHFTLDALLIDTTLAKNFANGSYATLYLAPHHYHRVHMPITGTLKKMIYVPGKLFSGNKLTATNVPELYSRNERVVCFFDTAAGSMAMVLVGALIVGNIQLAWTKLQRSKEVVQKAYLDNLQLQKGEELGHFQLGSTVIIVFGKDKINWSFDKIIDSEVELGQILGEMVDK